MKSKNIRPNWDAFTGLFSVAFGLIYGGQAYTMPRAMFGNPMDPIYFPLGIALLAIFIGVCLLVKSNFKASVMAFTNIINESTIKKNDRRRIFYTCLISISYALLFEHVGYVISTFLFMSAMLTITRCSWKTSIVVALVFAMAIFFIFNTLLAVSLPPLPFME
jgi:putative tricarboxylic transport membrane protein